MSKISKLEKILGKEKFAALKKWFNDEPLPPADPPADPPIELSSTALADGSGTIKGTLKEGETVVMVAADGTESTPADGEYMLEGGKMITVLSGSITAVSEEMPEEAMTEEKVLSAIQNALNKQEAAFNARIKAIEEKHATDMKAASEKFKQTVEAMEVLAGIQEEENNDADPKRKSTSRATEGYNRFQSAMKNIKATA